MPRESIFSLTATESIYPTMTSFSSSEPDSYIDGKYIDYVLVFDNEKKDKQVNDKELTYAEEDIVSTTGTLKSKDSNRSPSRVTLKNSYLKNLENAGLEVMEESSSLSNLDYTYYLLHAPIKTLQKIAAHSR